MIVAKGSYQYIKIMIDFSGSKEDSESGPPYFIYVTDDWKRLINV